jgi:heat shock protein HslJ
VILPGTTLTMVFGANGTVNGSAGCNSYSSTYLVNGNKLTITPPTGTSMMCAEPAAIMEQETTFLTTLPSAGSFSIKGTQLQILNASGKPLLDLLTVKR